MTQDTTRRWRDEETPAAALVLAHIRAGTCPWCEAGPFRVLAAHTWGKHRVDTRALRDMAGLTYTESICDPATAERLSEIAKERGTEHIGDARLRKAPRQMSTEGKRRAKQAASVVARDHLPHIRRPHPCPVCGTIIPRSHPLTCSPACREKVRSETAKAAHTGRVMGEAERAKKTAVVLAANERRRLAHDCPVCGTLVPKAQPLTCSRECANTWNSWLRNGLVEPKGRRAT